MLMVAQEIAAQRWGWGGTENGSDVATGFTDRELLFTRTDEQKVPGQHVHFAGSRKRSCWSWKCQFERGFHSKINLKQIFFCCFKAMPVPHSAQDKSKWAAPSGLLHMANRLSSPALQQQSGQVCLPATMATVLAGIGLGLTASVLGNAPTTLTGQTHINYFLAVCTQRVKIIIIEEEGEMLHFQDHQWGRRKHWGGFAPQQRGRRGWVSQRPHCDSGPHLSEQHPVRVTGLRWSFSCLCPSFHHGAWNCSALSMASRAASITSLFVVLKDRQWWSILEFLGNPAIISQQALEGWYFPSAHCLSSSRFSGASASSQLGLCMQFSKSWLGKELLGLDPDRETYTLLGCRHTNGLFLHLFPAVEL